MRAAVMGATLAGLSAAEFIAGQHTVVILIHLLEAGDRGGAGFIARHDAITVLIQLRQKTARALAVVSALPTLCRQLLLGKNAVAVRVEGLESSFGHPLHLVAAKPPITVAIHPREMVRAFRLTAHPHLFGRDAPIVITIKALESGLRACEPLSLRDGLGLWARPFGSRLGRAIARALPLGVGEGHRGGEESEGGHPECFVLHRSFLRLLALAWRVLALLVALGGIPIVFRERNAGRRKTIQEKFG